MKLRAHFHHIKVVKAFQDFLTYSNTIEIFYTKLAPFFFSAVPVNFLPNFGQLLLKYIKNIMRYAAQLP
jgi:hypothetical protein